MVTTRGCPYVKAQVCSPHLACAALRFTSSQEPWRQLWHREAGCYQPCVPVPLGRFTGQNASDFLNPSPGLGCRDPGPALDRSAGSGRLEVEVARGPQQEPSLAS